jgi:hypothetical protein
LNEQEEIQGLEGQIRLLSKKNEQLKHEESSLEQMLQMALEHVRKATEPHAGNYHNLENMNDCKPPATSQSRTTTMPHDGLGTDNLTELLYPSHHAHLMPDVSTLISQQLSCSLSGVNQASSHQSNHIGQREALEMRTGILPSSVNSSGEAMLAAIVRGINQSEAQMYELVSPLTANNLGSLQMSFQGSLLPPVGFDSMWTVLPPPTVEDSTSALQVHSSLSSEAPAFPNHLSQFATIRAKEDPMPKTNIDGPAMDIFPKFDRGHGENERDEDSIDQATYSLFFDNKVGGVTASPPPTDGDCSDQDSCNSVDIDRFLAVDLMVDDDIKLLASPKTDEM